LRAQGRPHSGAPALRREPRHPGCPVQTEPRLGGPRARRRHQPGQRRRCAARAG
jgi:hypothetical protein